MSATSGPQFSPTSLLARRQLLLQLPASALALLVRPRPSVAGTGEVVRDPAGFRFYDFRVGDGKKPEWGQLVRINYAGYTFQPDGSLRVFDSTFGTEDGEYLFKHGNGQTIKGLELALHTMAVGGKRRVVIPQETLGFTVGALGPLSPYRNERLVLEDEINKTERAGRAIDLIYDIELLSAVDDVNDRGLYKDVTITVAQQESGISLDQILREAESTLPTRL